MGASCECSLFEEHGSDILEQEPVNVTNKTPRDAKLTTCASKTKQSLNEEFIFDQNELD